MSCIELVEKLMQHLMSQIQHIRHSNGLEQNKQRSLYETVSSQNHGMDNSNSVGTLCASLIVYITVILAQPTLTTLCVLALINFIIPILSQMINNHGIYWKKIKHQTCRINH